MPYDISHFPIGSALSVVGWVEDRKIIEQQELMWSKLTSADENRDVTSSRTSSRIWTAYFAHQPRSKHSGLEGS